MLLFHARNLCRVAPQYQPIFRELGLDGETIFEHELIRPWRTLPGDRENCTLDATLADGRSIRWHVKRYQAPHGLTAATIKSTVADDEARAYQELHARNIPTAPLVCWGRLKDGRSFLISDDLTDYTAGDKLLESGVPFDRILAPTADLAAKLHGAGLHHRDLYLCHFFIRADDARADVRLIDIARVRKLGNVLTRRRWIVKDLAQFWYSTIAEKVTDAQRDAWLSRYAEQRKIDPDSLRSAIIRKSNWIARHDAALRESQPNRNVSIPT